MSTCLGVPVGVPRRAGSGRRFRSGPAVAGLARSGGMAVRWTAVGRNAVYGGTIWIGAPWHAAGLSPPSRRQAAA
jgi:hypothetical protein